MGFSNVKTFHLKSVSDAIFWQCTWGGSSRIWHSFPHLFCHGGIGQTAQSSSHLALRIRRVSRGRAINLVAQLAGQ